MSLDPYQVAATRAGDTFTFDYSAADLAATFVFGAGSWGLYNADGNVTVLDTITPAVDTDGVTSLAGSVTFSVTLWQLTDFVGAALDWDATGAFAVEYTVDGGNTWTTASLGGRVPLTSSSDFDVKVSFTGGVVSDTSALTSVTVYVLKTDTMPSKKTFRSLDFGSNVLLQGNCAGPVTVAAANENPPLDPDDTTTPSGTMDYTFSTVEMWATLAGPFNSWNTVFDSGDATTAGPFFWGFDNTGAAGGSGDFGGGTPYVNGVAVTSGYIISASRFLVHIVFVLDNPANIATFVGTDRTQTTPVPGFQVNYMALYSDKMTASDVADLYADSSGVTPTITITDSATIAVTESSPAVDIYAYTWSMVTGSKQ